MKTKYINKFLFDKAKYMLEDTFGNSIFVAVNYRENYFKIIERQTLTSDINLLIDEAGNIAKDLLKRKHDVNFAQKD